MPKFEKVEVPGKVLYPTPVVLLDESGSPAVTITVSDAKELLGWQDVAKGQGDYVREVERLKVFGTVCGLRGRCTNNVTNRPIYGSVLQTLTQEILRKRWQYNGEPVIIGRQRHVLNGQHCLLSLLIAAKLWADNEEWREDWPEEPTIVKAVHLGISEDDEVVNTLDTAKSRSLTDAIYRSDEFNAVFGSETGHERRVAARAADYAIRLLWHRTGASLDAFAPRRTHAESLDFLGRHPKILDCVKHITEEDGEEGLIASLVSTGYASGLLYLMGSSRTDPTAYRSADNPSEDHLDWSAWDVACDYWVKIAQDAEGVAAVRQSVSSLLVDGETTNAERWAVIVKGWIAYAKKEPVTKKGLALIYKSNEDGSRTLDECPVCGGVDLGDPEEADEEAIVDRRAGKAVKPPTPEQIEKRAAVERKKSLKTLQPRRASKAWAEGDVAWVTEDDDIYLGRLVEDPIEVEGGAVRVRVDAEDGQWEVDVDSLSLARPAEARKVALAPKPRPGSKLAGKSSPPGSIKKAGAWAVGSLAWVEDGIEPWQGRIVELHPQAARVRVEPGHRGSGTVRTVSLGTLRRAQPRQV
jgi:hypothetical protein